MVELLKGRLVVCPHSVSPRYKEIYKTMLLMKDAGITEGDLKQIQRSYKLREAFDTLLGSKGIATHNLTNRNMNTILKHYIGFYNVDVALWYDSGLVHSWFLDNVVRSKNDENVVLMSEEEYNNLMENLYIMSNKDYYNELLKRKDEVEKGKVEKHDLIEVE